MRIQEEKKDITIYDLPDTVYYQILRNLGRDDSLALELTGMRGEHFEQALLMKKEDNVFEDVSNSPVFSYLKRKINFDLVAFFSQLKELDREVNQLLDKGVSRERIIRSLKQANPEFRDEVLGAYERHSFIERHAYRKEQLHTFKRDVIPSLLSVSSIIALLTGLSLIVIGVVMSLPPVAILGFASVVFLTPILFPIFLGSTASAYYIATKQNLAEFDKADKKNLTLLDNLKGMTELASANAEENETVRQSEILRGLFLNSGLFKNTNSTGILNIQRELATHPFMSSERVFKLIQTSFESRSHLFAVQGFFCKINRASSVQTLYDLVREADFDLVNEADARDRLIDVIYDLEDKELEATRNVEVPTEITPLLQ